MTSSMEREPIAVWSAFAHAWLLSIAAISAVERPSSVPSGSPGRQYLDRVPGQPRGYHRENVLVPLSRVPAR